MEELQLLKPGLIRGFASAVAPSALPSGVVSLLQNVRLPDGTVRTRFGDVQVGGTLGGTATRGAFACSLNGTPHLFRAYEVGAKVRVAKSTDDGANWTDITSTTGAYGDTELTGSATAPVRFAVVRDNPRSALTAYDLLVITNGTDAPRIYGTNTTETAGLGAGDFISKVAEPPQPLTNGLAAYCAFNRTFPIGNAGACTYTEITAAKFSLGDSGGAGTNYMQGVLDSTFSTTADTVMATIVSGGRDFSEKRQLVIIGTAETEEFWPYIKVELLDVAANSLTIYDPSAGVGSLVTLERTGSGATTGATSYAYQLGYELPPSTGSFDYTDVDSIRFSYTRTSGIVADIAYRIYAIAAGGRYQGGSSFSFAYYQCHARQLGPSQMFEPVAGDLTLAGGPTINTSGANPFNLSIADDPRFYYDYYIYVPNPTQAVINTGVNYGYTYVNQPGETDYYLISALPMASYGGGVWSFVQGADSTSVPIAGAGYFGPEISFRDPGQDSVVLPTGAAVATANARTFVGQGSRLWFSDADRPFVFRRAADVSDSGSGSSNSFSGQTIQAIVPMGAFGGAAEQIATPVSGVASVLVLTDSQLWQLSGFTVDSLSRPIPIAPYGTLSPLSVGRNRLGVIWLADDGQVTRFSNSGIDRISVDLVDDKTLNIPSAQKVWVSGACTQERYYMGYALPAGTTNAECLVWDFQENRWESVDTAVAGSFEALVPYYDSGYVKLLRFGTTTLYEHDVPANTGNVAAAITFAEYGQYGKRFEATEMAVALDTVPTVPVSLTTGRYFPESQTTETGTISFTPTGYRGWQLDNLGAGGSGWTVRPSISGTLAGGTRLYSLTLKVRSTPQSASRS